MKTTHQNGTTYVIRAGIASRQSISPAAMLCGEERMWVESGRLFRDRGYGTSISRRFRSPDSAGYGRKALDGHAQDIAAGSGGAERWKACPTGFGVGVNREHPINYVVCPLSRRSRTSGGACPCL